MPYCLLLSNVCRTVDGFLLSANCPKICNRVLNMHSMHISLLYVRIGEIIASKILLARRGGGLLIFVFFLRLKRA